MYIVGILIWGTGVDFCSLRHPFLFQNGWGICSREFDIPSLFSGSEQSSGLPDDSFSSGIEEFDGDEKDEPAVLDDKDESAAESKDAANSGWADAMAKVLNKTVPKSKHTILVKNKARDKERETEKQVMLEKRRQVRK